MKFLQVFSLLLIFTQFAFSQQTALFETQIYFEDAVGNKDTIIIGYDTASSSFYNPEFGEENITAPFDSVFEVRAGHGISYGLRDYVLSKKIIAHSEPIFGLPYSCDQPEEIIFFIHTIHQPVKIKWESALFDGDSCIGGTFLTHFATHNSVFWWQLPERENRFYCASQIDSVELLLGRENNRSQFGELYYDLLYQIKGRGIDSIYGVAVGMTVPRLSTFACDIITSTATVTPPTSLSVYPNPTADLLHLKEGKLKWLKIYNQQGQIVWQIVQWNKWQSIDLSHLPSGVYFLQALQENKLVRQKILKL